MVRKEEGARIVPKYRLTVEAVVIDYTNWRGERGERTITPIEVYYGANEWHRERTWLLKAYDHKAQGYRTFAMSNVHSWKTEEIDKYIQVGKRDVEGTSQS